MALFILTSLFLASLSQVEAFDTSCPIILDGRVPPKADISWFDRNETPYRGFRGRNMKWSSLVSFPGQVQPSIFDHDSGAKPLAIEINQDSVLRPSNKPAETGHRQTTLVFNRNLGSNESAKGIVSYHWSVRQTKNTPLNFTHEYVSVFHERANGDGNHFQVIAGSIVGQENLYPARDWKVLDRTKRVIFQTPILPNEWENFAITLDYPRRTIQVYYSTGQNHLNAVTPQENNENDQGGLFHVGLLKKSTGAKDPLKDGYHSPQFREGLIYGGIFVEHSDNGCVSR